MYYLTLSDLTNEKRMKRKLDVPQSSDSKGESSQKRPRLTKTLPELLLEVSNGMFEDFHYYLQEQKEIDCDELDLSYCFDNDDPEYRPEYRDVNFYNLAQALKCTHIKSVSLDGNVLGSDKIVEFVKGLKDTEVTSIELAGNNIDDQGLAKLGEALKYTMVTDIDLSRNHIGNLGVAKFGENLKHTKIQKLNLSTNGIESSGAKALGEGLQESMVTSVDISCNYICSDGALMLIAALKDTKVTHLDLHATNITDILAIGNALQRTRITELNLSRNKIESDIIAFGEILKDKKITKLSLAHTHLNSEAAIAIVKTLRDTNVTDLDLSGNNISSDGIVKIGDALKNTKINTLTLANNNICTEDAVILVKSLRETEVSSLDLSFNGITSSDLELRTLWSAFIGTKITELKLIDLNDNVTNHNISELISIIPSTSLISVKLNEFMFFDIEFTDFDMDSKSKHDNRYENLTEALRLNKFRLTNEAWLLCRMWKIQENENPDAYSAERFEAESLGTTDPKNGLSAISYCFDLPPELQEKILSYLPFMSEHLKNANTEQRSLRKNVYMDLARDMTLPSMEP